MTEADRRFMMAAEAEGGMTVSAGGRRSHLSEADARFMAAAEAEGGAEVGVGSPAREVELELVEPPGLESGRFDNIPTGKDRLPELVDGAWIFLRPGDYDQVAIDGLASRLESRDNRRSPASGAPPAREPLMRGPKPTTTHQFIAHLIKLLNCRVILTTNFDQLLETAFAGEGQLPRVFEVNDEASFPSAQLLLSQPLSIVKFHGRAHQLETSVPAGKLDGIDHLADALVEVLSGVDAEERKSMLAHFLARVTAHADT